MAEALVNGRVLLDAGWQEGQAVVVHAGRIAAVVPTHEARAAGHTLTDLKGGLLLPGFIDTQVNGGGGYLFNDEPSVETIRAIGAAHRRFGTTSFLPTLISDDLAVMARAIEATRQALAAGVPGVIGVHIEGPFLNAAKKGVHDPQKFRDLDPADVTLLSSLGAGRTLVTLAPEMTTAATIRALVAAGVVISAGHSNATADEMEEALAAGVTGFTHLFNAMSPFTGREPGVVGAALYDQESWCGIIVDGRHVDPLSLKVALRAKRHDRFMLVSDAMPLVGAHETEFVLQGKRIHVDGGVCVDENGTLAGSAIDMASAVRNAVELLGIELDEAVRMASLYPASFLKLDHELGRIAPGYRANLLWATAGLDILESWIDGVPSARHNG